MFKWQEDIDHLGIPAHRVLRLHQSQNEVQVALPGFPSQEAIAYVCAFSVKSGLRVTIALHLKTSHRIAFFFHPSADTNRVAKDLLQEALDYAESMGFTLADTDYHLLTETQREKLWSGLLLSEGDHKENDQLEELDELQEEAETEQEEPEVEVVEETSEEIIEEPEEVEEIVEEIEITLDDEPVEEIETTLDDKTVDENPRPSPEIEKGLANSAEKTLATTEDTHIARFGRFLASF